MNPDEFLSMAPVAIKHKLGLTTLAVMIFVQKRKSLNIPTIMSDIARALGVETATITGSMDRLEKLDYAKRVRVPGDRRSYGAILTEKGKEALQAILMSGEVGA